MRDLEFYCIMLGLYKKHGIDNGINKLKVPHAIHRAH